MKVGGPGRTTPQSIKSTGKKQPVAGSRFQDSLPTAEVTSDLPVSGATRVAPVDALLSLQEVPDSASGRSTGVKLGKSLLDQLDDIRRGILLGIIPRSRLVAISVSIQNRKDAFTDPLLQEILDEIELRARVELAKYDYFD